MAAKDKVKRELLVELVYQVEVLRQKRRLPQEKKGRKVRERLHRWSVNWAKGM